jgi:cytochrome c553
MKCANENQARSDRASKLRQFKTAGMQIALIVALGTVVSGCANPDRSRDLGNPNVAPAVTAVQVCSNCHGVDGNSVSPNFPRLAGQQFAYLVAQLTNFRSHQRADPEGFEYMWGISRQLTDDQIKGLAEYFSKQVSQPNAAVDPQLMAAGKEIYEKGVPAKQTAACVACHQPKAEGAATFPRLADQHKDYLMKQLMVFRDTEGRPGTPMKQVTHFLDPSEIESVASYLQAFPKNN